MPRGFVGWVIACAAVFVLAAPVVLAEDYSRLPVGAVTLVSTAPAHESILTKLDLDIRQEIVEFLDEVVTEVLSN